MLSEIWGPEGHKACFSRQDWLWSGAGGRGEVFPAAQARAHTTGGFRLASVPGRLSEAPPACQTAETTPRPGRHLHSSTPRGMALLGPTAAAPAGQQPRREANLGPSSSWPCYPLTGFWAILAEGFLRTHRVCHIAKKEKSRTPTSHHKILRCQHHPDSTPQLSAEWCFREAAARGTFGRSAGDSDVLTAWLIRSHLAPGTRLPRHTQGPALRVKVMKPRAQAGADTWEDGEARFTASALSRSCSVFTARSPTLQR